jgi:uncharacterized protein YbjT (DUF2867 family)
MQALFKTSWAVLLSLLLVLTSAGAPRTPGEPAAKKKVLILGASGSVARVAIDLLKNDPDINLTLFLRDKSHLQNTGLANARLVVGDVFEYNGLRDAIRGQDVVYANLAGDLGKMAQNIVKAMNETGVKQLIFITSIGIYKEPVSAVLRPYRQAADVIEASNLAYTILRPTWYTDADEVDYEITQKGTPEKGSVISRKSLATFITEVIRHPEKYRRQSLGINKPAR